MSDFDTGDFAAKLDPAIAIETDQVGTKHDRGRIHRSVTDREHVSGGVADRDRINACRRMTH